MSRRFTTLAVVVVACTVGCFALDRVASLAPGSVVGRATRPDVDGSPGAGFVRVSGVGSNLVRVGDAEGVFVVGDLGPGRLDLRLVDDVDGDGWPDRGRDVSVFVANDLGSALGAVDVGALALGGTFGLRGTSAPVVDDSRVVRIYALRGRCAVGTGDASGSDLGDGACDDNVLSRFEHGVDGEAAADDTGAWQLTRLVAGRIELVAVLYEKNADGSLGAVVDVAGPFAVNGTATDLNDPPRDANVTIAFDEVLPPPVDVQLSLSRPVAAAAFAVVSDVGTALPGCDSARDAVDGIAGTFIVEIAAGASGAVASVPVGAHTVLVCDGDTRGVASSFVAVPTASTTLWPIVMLDIDACPFDPADPDPATRDCDRDDVDGIPLATFEALRGACARECFPDASQPFDSLGAALGARTCTVDDVVYDCDDDSDGQADVTEPVSCIGAGRGHDLDGDGLCSIVDSFPYCAANTAAACPAGDEAITPRVPVIAAGVLRGPVGAVVTIAAGDNSVAVIIASAATDNGQTLVYGEAAFVLAGIDSTPVTITPGDAVPGLVCAPVSSLPLVIGCEHGFDQLTGVGTFFDGSEVAVGGHNDDDDEGRYVAFASAAAVAGNTGGVRQVFWRDRGTGVTLLVSAIDGVAGTARSEEPAISADGLTVAFTTTGALVADDTNGTSDIYLWRVANPDVLERVSVAADGTEGDGIASTASLNADGTVAAFASSSSTISAGVTGTSTVNVFRKALVTGVVTLLSASITDGSGVGGLAPALSHDGNRIAFWSFSSAIVSSDQNGIWDIFVSDVAIGDVTRVTLNADGTERAQGNDGASTVNVPAISGDGRYVGWSSTVDTIVADDDNGSVKDVFVTEIATGRIVRASAGGIADSAPGNEARVAFSADGRFIVFTSADTAFGPVVVRDLITNTVTPILTGDVNAVGLPAISARGAYVVVGSATALDPRVPSTGIFAAFTGLAPSWWAAR